MCAVADCLSSSRKVRGRLLHRKGGWAPFPCREKQPWRRKVWETRCRRGFNWKATDSSRICSKHFREWTRKGPSQDHPDPVCFTYNDWGKRPNPGRSGRVQLRVPVLGGSLGRVASRVTPHADATTYTATPDDTEHYTDANCITAFIAAIPSPNADHSYSQTCRPVMNKDAEQADVGVQTHVTVSQKDLIDPLMPVLDKSSQSLLDSSQRPVTPHPPVEEVTTNTPSCTQSRTMHHHGGRQEAAATNKDKANHSVAWQDPKIMAAIEAFTKACQAFEKTMTSIDSLVSKLHNKYL